MVTVFFTLIQIKSSDQLTKWHDCRVHAQRQRALVGQYVHLTRRRHPSKPSVSFFIESFLETSQKKSTFIMLKKAQRKVQCSLIDFEERSIHSFLPVLFLISGSLKGFEERCIHSFLPSDYLKRMGRSIKQLQYT